MADRTSSGVPEARPLRLPNLWSRWGSVATAPAERSGLDAERDSACPDPLPIDELVRNQLDFVWRLLRRLGLSPARADDVTQEVFLVAVRRQAEISPGRERAFLYGVAVRLAANARRQERRRREVYNAELEQMEAGTRPDLALEQQRAAAELDALLDELPEKLRRVLVLSDVLELEVGEVATCEGIARGTVASRLKRARALFRKKLSLRQRQIDPIRGGRP